MNSYSIKLISASLVATALGLLTLIIPVQPAVAGMAYSTKTATIPSGGNGLPEPGGGARITNKAFGYYIGRVMPGGQFTRLGGRASHHYGRIVGPGVNLCGWLHKSALDQRTGRRPTNCSRAAANRLWQRKTVGQQFSTPAGTKGHSGTQVKAQKPNKCLLYYNYFNGNDFRGGALRNSAGPIGTAPKHRGVVKYRYQTLDGQAVVIYDYVYGWGFTERGCVSLHNPKSNQVIKRYNDADRGTPPRF